ncbi:hypothetical protein BD324DRAFT_34684 [Kockovaella imperatae]|uniref:Uncharacterized protein n=1 Tax=Kockovaella imperatae TaxID=4999 RepID=A0A1Y1USQ0_9TREE|nr:hypothetical protein BD324DRAFT_34684 [Kockovaella imperatae]ORX41038.1 hypothetical protein BD324DRAFT_34684 [Kockovaella imperatae]
MLLRVVRPEPTSTAKPTTKSEGKRFRQEPILGDYEWVNVSDAGTIRPEGDFKGSSHGRGTKHYIRSDPSDCSENPLGDMPGSRRYRLDSSSDSGEFPVRLWEFHQLTGIDEQDRRPSRSDASCPGTRAISDSLRSLNLENTQRVVKSGMSVLRLVNYGGSHSKLDDAVGQFQASLNTAGLVLAEKAEWDEMEGTRSADRSRKDALTKSQKALKVAQLEIDRLTSMTEHYRNHADRLWSETCGVSYPPRTTASSA